VDLRELKTIVVMPAFNAEKTLVPTCNGLPEALKREVILVDDGSTDRTIEVAEQAGLRVLAHSSNRGYGANQKTCYDAALDAGADIVIMVHPDNQYDSRLAGIMAEIIELGVCDLVLGNRIRTRKEALDGGMPLWKYLVNRTSTLFENFILGQSIGDFHSGMRAYSREVLERIPYAENANGFSFDQEMIIQAVHFGFRIGDIPVPVRYFSEASSIGLIESLRYGRGALSALFSFFLHRAGVKSDARYS
jgi:glycosyltransferase involved in cell wall biosynthesis